MEVKPVTRQSISEKIVGQLRKMIDEGRLKPGDRLPAERALAEMFGVSRTTVREGIKCLAESGVLESRQGAGTFVSEVGSRKESAILSLLSGDHDMRDVFAVRKMLEPEIAALAAQKRTSTDLFHLESVLGEQEEAIRSGDTGSDYDERFHQLLAEASKNPVLLEMVRALHDSFAESRAEITQSDARKVASLEAHKSIVEAVRNRHGMQAERAMREHLDEVEDIIFGNQK